jgi:hypothetical protein
MDPGVRRDDEWAIGIGRKTTAIVAFAGMTSGL